MDGQIGVRCRSEKDSDVWHGVWSPRSSHSGTEARPPQHTSQQHLVGAFALEHTLCPNGIVVGTPIVWQVQDLAWLLERAHSVQGIFDHPDLPLTIEGAPTTLMAEREVEEDRARWQHAFRDVSGRGDSDRRNARLLNDPCDQSDRLMTEGSGRHHVEKVHRHVVQPTRQLRCHLLLQSGAAKHPAHEGEVGVG